ncbi:acyl-CoA carboxylase subunit epsilon [Nonomuraea sp. NPDC050394]|uniref:acyl-CoA carboxylase subunit epsilon n=1 Tax=Nonomuraea sp. NPDC050394 TaxID=3364363 RepID=UPI0037A3320B
MDARSAARTSVTTHERSESNNTVMDPRRSERKSTVTAHLKVVRGDATPEEIAALVTVLTTRQPEPTHTPGRKPETWRNPARAMRRRLVPGKSAWRLSALP